MSIGKKLREIRRSKGFTMKELSNKSKVSQSYISDLENEKNNKPSIDILNKLANALEINVNYFFEDNSLINELAERAGNHIVDDIYPLIDYVNKSRFDNKYNIKAIFSNSDLIDLSNLIDDIVSNRLRYVAEKSSK